MRETSEGRNPGVGRSLQDSVGSLQPQVAHCEATFQHSCWDCCSLGAVFPLLLPSQTVVTVKDVVLMDKSQRRWVILSTAGTNMAAAFELLLLPV